MRARFSLFVLLWLAATGTAAAQPYAWSTQYFYARPISGPPALTVRDMTTNVMKAYLPFDPLTTPGRGRFTADGRHYLMPTSRGILRFDPLTVRGTSFGEAMNAGEVWPSANGRWIHVALANGGYRILDATTGATMAEECCTAVTVAFSPDGTTRYVARRPYADPEEVVPHRSDSCKWKKLPRGAFDEGRLSETSPGLCDRHPAGLVQQRLDRNGNPTYSRL